VPGVDSRGMKRLAAPILTALLLGLTVFVPGASAANATGPEVLSFGAKRGEFFDLHGGRVRLRFYGTREATPFSTQPLHREGQNLGPKGIAAATGPGSVLTVELHNGRPEADSIAVRVTSIHAKAGQLTVLGRRVDHGRVRATLDNADARLPKLMRGAVLTLDLNPSGSAVEGPDGKRFENAAVGFIRVPLGGGSASAANVERLGAFTHSPEWAGAGHAEVILWQWIEKTSFECSMYENEPQPMTVSVESNLEGPSGVTPLHFSGPRNETVIHVDEKTPSGYAAHLSVSAQYPKSLFSQFELWAEAGEGNSEYAEMEIICHGNEEGVEPPPAPEPPPSQEERRWGKIFGPLFEL
jgi:hypothetical protein